MTTDDGSSRSQAEVHNEVRKDLRDADADQLEETLERDLVIPFITLNWGPQQNYPSVYLREPESADVKLLTEALNILVPLGLRVETSEVRDKLGFSDPAPDAECLQAPQASVPAPVALPAAKEQAMNREGPTRFSPDQQALEDMIAGVMPDAVQITADIGREIDGLIRKAKSFEDLQALLAAFLDQDGEDPLQDALQRALVAADMHGRDMIGGEDAD
jgi:phage gp29-like protein